jgi:hypothetical protein
MKLGVFAGPPGARVGASRDGADAPGFGRLSAGGACRDLATRRCGGSSCGANLECLVTSGSTATCQCGGQIQPCCGGNSCGPNLTCSALYEQRARPAGLPV